MNNYHVSFIIQLECVSGNQVVVNIQLTKHLKVLPHLVDFKGKIVH